jgi:hypothetical protein
MYSGLEPDTGQCLPSRRLALSAAWAADRAWAFLRKMTPPRLCKMCEVLVWPRVVASLLILTNCATFALPRTLLNKGVAFGRQQGRSDVLSDAAHQLQPCAVVKDSSFMLSSTSFLPEPSLGSHSLNQVDADADRWKKVGGE